MCMDEVLLSATCPVACIGGIEYPQCARHFCPRPTAAAPAQHALGAATPAPTSTAAVYACAAGTCRRVP
eukprot:gene50718-55624_t